MKDNKEPLHQLGSQGYATIEDMENEKRHRKMEDGEIYDKLIERTTYQGWLVSPKFWKRALAAYGHVVAVNATLFLMLYAVAIIID